MLNKMSLLLAAATMALSAGAASAASLTFGNDNHHNRGNSTALSVDFGTVAFGYSDGYWDTSHRWHNWRNSGEYRNYRSHGQHFHNGRHDRQSNNGWLNR